MDGCGVLIVILFALSVLWGALLIAASVYDRVTETSHAARHRARTAESDRLWREHYRETQRQEAESRTVVVRLQQKQLLLQDLDRQIEQARAVFRPAPPPSVVYLPPTATPIAYAPSTFSGTAYSPTAARRTTLSGDLENDL